LCRARDCPEDTAPQGRGRSINIYIPKDVKRSTPTQQRYHKGCEEKHSHTAAHHPVIKPAAVASTAVSHTPTQQQGCGNY